MEDSSDNYDLYTGDNEISQVFSSALDSISHVSDDENDGYSTSGEQFAREIENKKRNSKNYHSNDNNFLSTSTPMHSRTLKTQNRCLDSNQVTGSKYSYSNHGDLFSHPRTSISPKMNGFTNHKQKENIDCIVKSENDNYSRISYLQDECTALSKNYKTLKNEFHKLENDNAKYIKVIEKQNAKICSLKKELEEETHLKENAIRNLQIMEDTVNSLEAGSHEYTRTDFYSKATKSHQKEIESLKQKYEHELNLARGESDRLREELHEKDEELKALRTASQKKAFSEEIKLAIQSAENVVYQKMQDKINLQANLFNEKKNEWKKNYDTKIVELKEDLQTKLCEDVQTITQWLSDSVQEDGMEPIAVPNRQLNFAALQQLCDYLNSYLKEYETRIRILVSEFRKAKKDLEDALVQSQMASEASVRAELEMVKQDNVRVTQKLVKYKECYKALHEKHLEEVKSVEDYYKRIIAEKRYNENLDI